MKKIFNIVLSVCMLMVYSVPAFAYTSEDAVKVELSDQVMSEALGAGAMDCQIVKYSASTGEVQANISNRSASSATYDLDIVDVNGNVLEDLASGGLANLNNSAIISAVASDPYQNFARIRLISGGVPGLDCMHAIESE